MPIPLMLLMAVVGVAVVYVLVPVATSVFARYRARRVVRCPETGENAGVQIDARHAALTAFPGPPEVRVQECSRWPERHTCDQACVAEERS